jgi:hypothetical protein
MKYCRSGYTVEYLANELNIPGQIVNLQLDPITRMVEIFYITGVSYNNMAEGMIVERSTPEQIQGLLILEEEGDNICQE